MRRLHFAFSAFVLFLAAQPMIAATPTFYVGNCRAGAFFHIMDAVTTVPAGSIVNVCAGTYAEQVVISKALTLQGVFSDNSTQVLITVPSGGLTTTSSISLGTIAAQVQVTAGPVNLNNLTVDGTASANCPSSLYVGIFYSSGSSGKVNEVETQNQNCINNGSSNGIGILAENTAGAAQSVLIENNDVHDYSTNGIQACSDQTPSTLTATIKSNYIGNTGVGAGILSECNVAGTVSGNTIVGGNYGISAASASSPVSGNTITGTFGGIFQGSAAAVSGNTIVNASNYGIFDAGLGPVSSNHILNGGNIGIFVDAGSGPVSSNRILNSPTGIQLNASSLSVNNNTIIGGSKGIDFFCISGNTVSGNVINGAFTGTDGVPATFIGVNTFVNVTNVRTVC